MAHLAVPGGNKLRIKIFGRRLWSAADFFVDVFQKRELRLHEAPLSALANTASARINDKKLLIGLPPVLAAKGRDAVPSKSVSRNERVVSG